MRRSRTLSFAVVLASSIGILVLAAVGAVLGIQLWASGQSTVELVNEKAQLLVDKLEIEVRGHLAPAEVLSEFVAERIESGDVALTDKGRLADLLTGSLAGTPQLNGVFVFDSDLQQFGIGRAPTGQTVLVEQDESEDPLVQEAFAELEGREGSFWGRPVHAEGNTFINLRRPLRRDGELLGLLVTVATVPELSEIVTNAGDLFGATAFILYGSDRVLAHPNLTVFTNTIKGDDPLVPLNEVGDFVLGGIWESQEIPWLRRVAGGETKLRRQIIGEQRYILLYKWIETYGDVPWLFGAWLPAEDLSASILRLVYAGAAGFAILLIAIVCAVVLGHRIARPIQASADQAERVGRFDLGQVEALPRSRISEIDQQARAFNTMLAGLRSFETYVPKTLVSRLISSGDTVASQERDLTVMFTDIVGFTAMAEGQPAQDIAHFLNDHFDLLGRCVEAEAGTVDKFIGDALMAFWGAPDSQDDHAVRACRAALAMVTAIEADNATREREGRLPVHIRIGVHCGPVVVGNIGSEGRINYTIVGDTVNTCQRLESLGKEFGGDAAVTILISGETAARLDERFALQEVGAFEVKGRKEPVQVWRLLPTDRPALEPASTMAREATQTPVRRTGH